MKESVFPVPPAVAALEIREQDRWPYLVIHHSPGLYAPGGLKYEVGDRVKIVKYSNAGKHGSVEYVLPGLETDFRMDAVNRYGVRVDGGSGDIVYYEDGEINHLRENKSGQARTLVDNLLAERWMTGCRKA
jgi:hypothetical protein